MSLDQPLIDFLSNYQEAHQLRSRSEVVAQALTLLRERELEDQYAAALTEWQDSGEAELWEVTVADGLDEGRDAAR